MVLSERIRAMRSKSGLTLTSLARRARVSKAYLSQLENGRVSHPSAEVVVKISRALGCTVDTLLGAKVAEPLWRNGSAVPQSLRALAREENLPIEHITMLSQISYQGRQPTSVEGWRLILEAIRNSIQNG